MGVCNCNNLKFSLGSNVEVEKLGQKLTDNISSRKKSLLKVKSVRFSNMEKFQSAQKVTDFLVKEEIAIKENEKDSQATNQQQSTDNCYNIVEHDINEEEEQMIKKALTNHFLFKEMTDEIL
jgi:hypothetical protein